LSLKMNCSVIKYADRLGEHGLNCNKIFIFTSRNHASRHLSWGNLFSLMRVCTYGGLLYSVNQSTPIRLPIF
jgi:hypothetical protein